MTTRPFIFSTIAITAVVYALVFFIVCIVSFFLERFRALNGMDRFTWWAKGTKIFYCPIPIFTGLWYLLVDDTLKDDVVNGTTKTAFVAIYIHVGFNLFDSILMAVGKLLYGNRFSTALFIHHFAILNLYSVATYYNGKGQYLSMLGFIDEMAGPLSYANWMLAKAKLSHLSIWRVNQQISVYLWCFQSMLEIYFFYTVITNWSHIWKELPIPLLITASFSVLLTSLGLNPHWTKAEAKRLYRLYGRKISFYYKTLRKNLNKT